MKRNVVMIGLRPEEDGWVRLLVALLRDPDPTIGELARQALDYVEEAARRHGPCAAANQ